jgi:formyltetrahydrofolate deformylase
MLSYFLPPGSTFDLLLRVLIMVSKSDHCLANLLYRFHKGELPIEITAIVSNHKDLRHMAEREGIRFVHLPINKENKREQELALLDLVKETETELVVLARYMQILSDSLCKELAGNAINIHHSFLPGFKGARPYHQAYDRGVKLIGATAHYVTSDLDEGPIIEQEVMRVSHKDSVESLIRKGRDLEKIVLARAVWAHLKNKVLVFQEPHIPHTSLSVEPCGKLFQLLLPNQLLPESQLLLVIHLLQPLPGCVDISNHLALFGTVWHLVMGPYLGFQQLLYIYVCVKLSQLLLHPSQGIGELDILARNFDPPLLKSWRILPCI